MLVSLCEEGRLKAWDVKRRRSHLSEQGEDDDDDDDDDYALCDAALEGGFVPTALAHPPAYLNKVVVGSESGALQLWNVRTGRYVCPMVIWRYGDGSS